MIVVVVVYLSYSMLPESRVIKDYPRLMHLAYGAHFLQGTLRVMISAATQENYQPYRRNNVLMWILMGVNAVSLYTSRKPVVDEFLMICLVVTSGWLCVMHQIYYTIEDFKRILNIKMFTIKPKVK